MTVRPFLPTDQRRQPVTEAHDVGEARRVVTALARDLSFSDERTGTAALIATELAHNLRLHGNGGELLVRGLGPDSLEMLAVDSGPGMADVERCLTDGYSTGGTSGTGLGAIRRKSDGFDLHSLPGKGTVILSEVWREAGRRPPVGSLTYGIVTVPKSGQTVCGDSWTWIETADGGLAVVADGLGHGPLAAEASTALIDFVRSRPGGSPADLLAAAHGALRHTRGAAAAIAAIRPADGFIDYAGVGNIVGLIALGERQQHMVSLNGTIGHEVPKVRSYPYAWAPSAVMIMHSDGLHTRWRFDAYPGLSTHHPGVIAGVIYRDGLRGTDDATVLVVKATGVWV